MSSILAAKYGLSFPSSFKNIANVLSTANSLLSPGINAVLLTIITAVLIFPHFFLKNRYFWTDILDAVGIMSFAIQGSMIAIGMGRPVSAVIVAALLTATGGGVFRDLLAHRRSILLDENIYGLWIFLVGLILGSGWATTNTEIIIVFVMFTILRILSYKRNWKVPYRAI